MQPHEISTMHPQSDRRERAHVGEVLTRVRTTGLLARSSSGDGLNGALQQVAELEGLDEVTKRGANQPRHSGTTLIATHEFQIMLLSLIPTCSKVL